MSVCHPIEVSRGQPGLPPAAGGAGSKSPSYRKDIDGLRAIAVTSVVLFHAGSAGFRSGFLGVDIFFVISGYLIGGILLRGIRDGNFRFRDFYARRARRILPALFVVIAFICLFGALFLGAGEFHAVAGTSMSALLASSNISFWHHQDYFDADSRLFPLLMTWSLGVEEQFYILFPVILLATMKWAPRQVNIVLAGLVAASFAFSAWCSTAYPTAAFFLLPSRAWELGAGALLAGLEATGNRLANGLRAKPAVREAVGVIGLAMLLAAVCGVDDSRPVPGLVALLPVLGSVAVIWAEGSLGNRTLLSSPPMVFIGKISYSWYLWHWPLMSCVRLVAVDDPPVAYMIVISLVALLMAVVSWRFVEQPFREVRFSSRRTLLHYGAVLAALVLVTGIVKVRGGLSERLSDPANHVEATIEAGRGDCLATFEETHPDLSGHCVSHRDGRPTVALIGDSYAAALGPGLRVLADQQNLGVAILTKSACPPLLGVMIEARGKPYFADACAGYVSEAVQTISGDPTVKTVVMAGHWSAYAAAPGKDRREGVARTIDALRQAGKDVVYVEEVPSWSIDPVHLAFAQTIHLRGALARALWSTQSESFPTGKASALLQQWSPDLNLPLQRVAEQRGARLFDPDLALCSMGRCAIFSDAGLLYLDKDHLSTIGSAEVMNRLAIN